MSDKPLIALAEAIAKGAHEGQVDKGGLPYFLHPERVAKALMDDGASVEAVAVGYLHDVLEDTTLSRSDLLACGFPMAVVEAVEAISKGAHEPHGEYYDRVKANPLALLVKVHDINDNASPARLAQLDPKTQHRLTVKYAHAREHLGIV